MDTLFNYSNYDDKTILEIVKSNDFKYASSLIKTHEQNLYISDETLELEQDEVEQLRRFSCKNLETVLINFQKILAKFNRYQVDKRGNFGLYFKFFDATLFTQPIAFEKIVEHEEKLHPVFNSVFISSMYTFRCLVAYYFGKIDHTSKVLAFLLREQDGISPPLEHSFRETAIAKIRKELNDQYEEITAKIDAFYPLVTVFLTNIMDCMNRNNACDVEYLSTYPDQIFGIIQSLCKLPKNEMVKCFMDSCLVKLYLSACIPKLVRFDIFNCITKNRELSIQLLREIEDAFKPGILLNDALDFGRSEEHLYEFIASIKCLRIYSNKMKRTGTLSHIFEYIGYNVENMRYLIVLMFEYITKCLGHIYKKEENERHEIDMQLMDELTNQIIMFLKMIKFYIRIYPDLINCHLVHYIPYVIINIWNSFKDWVDDTIAVQMSKILSECSANNDFINYFASLISTNVREYAKLIFFDISKIEKRLELFNKLSGMETEFIDPLQSTFILKVAFIPMSGTDPMLCDKYVIESYLRTKPEHPFTREKMTIDDFKKIQSDLNDVIIAKETQRKQFVYENK